MVPDLARNDADGACRPARRGRRGGAFLVFRCFGLYDRRGAGHRRGLHDLPTKGARMTNARSTESCAAQNVKLAAWVAVGFQTTSLCFCLGRPNHGNVSESALAAVDRAITVRPFVFSVGAMLKACSM